MAAAGARYSAGIVLYRRRGAEPEFLLLHPGGPFWANRDEGAWSIPKGEIGEGEEPLLAAQREFFEETGMRADPPFIALAPIRQRSGKRVVAFACEGDFDPSRLRSNEFELEWPPKSGRHVRFPEVDRAGWFTLAEARAKLLPAQLPLLEELIRRL